MQGYLWASCSKQSCDSSLGRTLPDLFHSDVSVHSSKDQPTSFSMSFHVHTPLPIFCSSLWNGEHSADMCDTDIRGQTVTETTLDQAQGQGRACPVLFRPQRESGSAEETMRGKVSNAPDYIHEATGLWGDN